MDDDRFARVDALLAVQEREARWWRDASLAYFQTFSRMPIAPPHAPPAHPLAWYEHLAGCPADPRKPRCDAVP